ncbi:hypothetical protein M7I_3943 [Glarea lozoyensis 74030]|uniref:Uncharacterized protein n=1 Tax=Glarea lozoyensis (strain ATCC 74030 / MF5533) TaxID=1104152 RepID=H0EMU5_GLAL7|nr:hypothetical protein M7I_3943 [Glarea lozoyensis 74030]
MKGGLREEKGMVCGRECRLEFLEKVLMEDLNGRGERPDQIAKEKVCGAACLSDAHRPPWFQIYYQTSGTNLIWGDCSFRFRRRGL